jgi:predicted GIY-YIG superfamily endonuclease
LIADLYILRLDKVVLEAKQLLPEYSGIYYVLDQTNNVWYIGQAKNIRKRWQGKAHHRIYQLEAQKKLHFTIYYEQASESQLNSIEKQRIEKYHPHLNASPVKTKNLRPTETLLRETLVAIADFAFILGVEVPRKQIIVCIDLFAFKEKFKPLSTDEERAIRKAAFTNSKTYAGKWVGTLSEFYSRLILLVNGYEVIVMNSYEHFIQTESQAFIKYETVNLASESIKALTAKSLSDFQKIDTDNKFAQNLSPYTSDLIKPLFNEIIDREAIKKRLNRVSEDYQAGKRGIGSRTKIIDIDWLLSDRNIDLNKYSREDVKFLPHDRIGICIKSFIVTPQTPREYFTYSNGKKGFFYNLANGILEGQKIEAASLKFNTIYLLNGVDKIAWLLVEEYLRDFAKPATKLNNGEGYVEQFYISPRKYIVPAKVNIKLENIGYSAWIPFGLSEEFPTFEIAKEEIRRRLQNSDLPELKLSFKREAIAK